MRNERKEKNWNPTIQQKQRNNQISVINLCKRLIRLQKMAVAIIFYGFVMDLRLLMLSYVCGMASVPAPKFISSFFSLA